MAPARFSQVSRYRNATLTQAKPDERFSELSLGSTPDSGSGKLLAVSPTSSHIFARSSTSPSALIVLPHSATRKYGKQPPLFHNASSGQLGDFDVCHFQDNDEEVLLAAGSLQGDVTVQRVKLPLHNVPSDQTASVTLPAQDPSPALFKTPTSKAIVLLSFHPTSSPLFLTASNQESTIDIWDSNRSSSVIHFDGGSSHWDAKWSPDGRQLAAYGKDAKVRLWDPRNATECVVTINAHASKIKPGKVTFIKATQSHLLLTTGFSQMRQREIAIYDQRNSGTPLKRITLDVGSSALEPVCDYDRGIVYMVAKGESSVRWVDVGSEDQGGNFAEGAHALNFATTSAAIGPSIKCDTGVGEIAKLFIASTAGGSGGGASAVDTINPASIRVPRRTYIDFHSDLYPLTPVRHGSGLESAKWMQGDDASLPLLSLDPAARGQVKQNGSASHSSSQGLQPTSEPIAPSAAQPSVQPIAPSATQTPIQTFPAAAPPAATPKVTSQAKRAQESSTPSIPPPTTAQNTAERKMADQDKPAAPAVHWSRRFLAGSTPLIPSFQNLTSLDNSRAPAAKMVAASTDIFFVPLAGPGGRLGVHPLKREGRLPMQMPSFSHGAPLGDFAVDPFHQDQIITSAADGVIRLWKIPSLPGDGQDWPQNLAEQPLTAASLPTDQGSNKVAELCPHPHADGLVAVIPADVDGKIHLVDVRKGGIVKSIGVPAQGLYNAVWSPDGSVLAGAGKDRNLYILDVRGKSPIALTLGQAPAHDSPRPFSIVWINDRYLLTVGHTTGSLRQVKLFAIDDADLENSLTEVAKHNLDVSPSILFPYWDADVDVLWLWSKGERLISTFEVQPDNVKEPFLALTAFQHNHPQLGVAFMRKDCVNVREVEIASSVRLCKDEVQKVAWSITRSRPEYFQDDIYKPAVVIDKPLISIEEWKSGKDAQDIPRKSLQPEGMQPLSLAPPVVRTSTLSKGPQQREKTDKEREDEVLNSIFEKAKGNDETKDPNHNEDQAARAPDEDDWDSD